MKKLAIITTHPIQYYAPVFRMLHERANINVKVFYTWGSDAVGSYDRGFNKNVKWDLPLLTGYPYEWVLNTSVNKGSHHFKGVVNPDLNKRISDFAPDAILVFGWAYHGHLKAIRYFKGRIPVYFRGDSTLLDGLPLIRKWIKTIFLKWLYKHIDHAFYVGTNNKAYFKRYGLREGQLSFAPHAVDNQRFAEPRLEEAQALRTRLGVKPNEIIILFAGKFEHKKDPPLLIDAFLNLKNAACHLLLVGNGKLEDVLRTKARENSKIYFMDFQNQLFMPVIYQACDVFCLPSQGPGESWGLAVNEAMACGKAIIASNKVGCAVDLVLPNNGAIFKNGDVESLTNVLNELLTDTVKLNDLGEQSRTLIADWNFKSIAEAIEKKT